MSSQKTIGIVIAIVIVAAVAYAFSSGSPMMNSNDAMQQQGVDSSAAGGTMLTGSENPDNGMVGGDAMVGGDIKAADNPTDDPAPEPTNPNQLKQAPPTNEPKPTPGTSIDAQLEYKAKQGTSGSAR